jgi:hypothetical protein
VERNELEGIFAQAKMADGRYLHLEQRCAGESNGAAGAVRRDRSPSVMVNLSVGAKHAGTSSGCDSARGRNTLRDLQSDRRIDRLLLSNRLR